MKKLTLFKSKAIACLILMCLALAQGCKKDLLQPNSKDFQNGLSIAEAKKYFEANVKQIAKTKKLMSSGSVTPNINEESAEEILNSRELIWESAYQKLISTGNAVKIPLNFGKTYAVVDAAKKELIPFGSLNYLFMYKDSLQKIHSEWVILLPDKAWLYGKREQYTGKIVVKNWEGNFIKSYDYKGITPVKSLSLFPGKLNNRMANSAPETGVPPVDPTDPTNPDVWVICITKCHEFCGETIVDSRKCIMMRNPEDPEGGGGGGGGGGSSNGGGRNGGSPGFGQGGGGAAGSDYFPPSGPNCNPDPTYTMPSYPAPLGYSWIMKCDQPGAVPLPAGPTINSSRLNSIINFMGITDPDKQNFLLTHDDIYEAFENYLVTNGDSPENKEFIDWAVGYLMENPSISLTTFKEDFLQPTVFDNPSNPINAPDDAVINNGIEVENILSEFVSSGRLIASSSSRGNTEDMTWGTNGNISGIRSGIINNTNTKLFGFMTRLFELFTINDTEMLPVANDFIETFRNNTGGSMSHSTLNRKVQESSAYINFTKKFGEELRKKLRATNGNINEVAKFNLNYRPIFSGLKNKFNGLQILINDTEQTDIKIDSYSIDANNEFTASLSVTIHDHFGLDKHDALTYQYKNLGFAAWWLLQHTRGYRPFETIINIKTKIHGHL